MTHLTNVYILRNNLQCKYQLLRKYVVYIFIISVTSARSLKAVVGLRNAREHTLYIHPPKKHNPLRRRNLEKQYHAMFKNRTKKGHLHTPMIFLAIFAPSDPRT